MKTQSNFSNQRATAGLLRLLLIAIIAIFTSVQVSAQQSFILNLQGQTLSFKETSRTVLVNGGNNGFNQGSIHKYANVITKDGITVYAKLTISQVVTASITLFDDDAITGEINRFQPRIKTN